jgi:hypothetical protein
MCAARDIFASSKRLGVAKKDRDPSSARVETKSAAGIRRQSPPGDRACPLIDIVGYSKLLIEEQKERLTSSLRSCSRPRRCANRRTNNSLGCDGRRRWRWSFVTAWKNPPGPRTTAGWRVCSTAFPARLQGRSALHRLRAKDRGDAESRGQAMSARPSFFAELKNCERPCCITC